MTKEQFAAFFGPIIRVFAIVKRPSHAVSLFGGVWYAYSSFNGQLESFGLEDVLLFAIICWSLTALAPTILEYLHFYVPSTFFRMLFQPKTYLTTFKGWAMFLLMGAMLAGITIFSQHSSSQGGMMAVEYRKENSDKPVKEDLTSDFGQYSSDSATAVAQYDGKIAAIEHIKKSEKAVAAQPYDKEIRNYEAALRVHRQELKRGYVYAPSWIDKRKGQIGKAKAERESAVQSAGVAHDTTIARLELEKTTTLLALSAEFKGVRQQAKQRYEGEVMAFDTKMNNLSSFADGIGFWVVLLIVALDFLIVFYEVHSGHEYVGVKWQPSDTFTRWAKALGGIFEDKGAHLLERTEITREELKKRQSAKAFVLPSGRHFVKGSALLFTLFAATQLPDLSSGQFSQLSLVPSPWNWVVAIAAVAGLVLAFPEWKRAFGATVPTEKSEDRDNSDNRSDSSDKEATEKPETPVGQRGLDYEGIAENISPELLQSYKDQFRHSQVRQHTSATSSTRDRHARLVTEAFGVLSAVGYSFVQNGRYAGTHNIDGKPTIVSFEKKTWQA